MLTVLVGCSSKPQIKDEDVSETTTTVEVVLELTNPSQSVIPFAGHVPTTIERSCTQENPLPTSAFTESKLSTSRRLSTTAIGTSAVKHPISTTVSYTKKPAKTTVTNSTTTAVPNATAADAQKIAQLMVEYINCYRSQNGVTGATILPGLTDYAVYRSQQLVFNFAHDVADERKAATALRYGDYINPPDYGMIGEPYYTTNAREAIIKAGYAGTVDIVARQLALLVRNSPGHWNYVGGQRYRYIAVGVTYESGLWYCDIAVSSVNTDE